MPAIGLLMALLAVAGCRRGEYSPDAKFVDLYVELKLATVVFAADMEKVNEMRRVILAQHGMTAAEFHGHYLRLAENPGSWRNFQDQVIRQVEAFKKSHKGV